MGWSQRIEDTRVREEHDFQQHVDRTEGITHSSEEQTPAQRYWQKTGRLSVREQRTHEQDSEWTY
jgi:hypothetical protein